MNHIFRSIWSDALNTFVAVSEITPSKGKSHSCVLSAAELVDNDSEAGNFAKRNKRLRFKPLIVALACCFSLNAQANPTGAQVVNGTASIAQSGNLLTVTNSPNAIINWQGFSIGSSETTRFIQQTSSSSVLNRVIGADPSSLLGTLTSNGKVFLINPAGILVGPGANINVPGFVASTLNLSNSNFLAGNLNFTANPNAGTIQNNGTITTPEGGSVYLVAPQITNNGIINTPKGETILAAGNTVQLVDTGTPGVSVQITGSNNTATNLGQILADSGQIGVVGAVVKNSGTISASSMVSQGGRVFLQATNSVEAGGTISAQGVGGGNISVLADKQSGTVNVTGTLDASAPFAPTLQKGVGGISVSANGGFIETSAAHVQIADTAHITTTAANGKSGTWLIDPYDFTIAATGGDISGLTLDGLLNSNSVVISTTAIGTNSGANRYGTTGTNGDIFVNDSVSWGSAHSLTLNAFRNVNINAAISNTGTGDLDVSAGGGITVNQNVSVSTAGNVTLGIASGTGSVTIASGASVTGNNVNVSILGGQIAINGSLTSNNASGSVTLDSGVGQIYSNDSGLITANNIGLQSNGGTGQVGYLSTSSIGGSGNANISIGNGTTGPGYVYLNHTGDATLTSFTLGSNAEVNISTTGNLIVNAAINASQYGNVTLRADSLGACTSSMVTCSNVSFTGSGSVTAGATNIYYNPTGSHNANATSLSYNTPIPTNYINSGTITGTLNAYMLVNDVTQLQAVNTNLAGLYAQGKNIDATATATWNPNGSGGYYGFMPIGNNSDLTNATRFTGTFDGFNHTISNLYINQPSTDYVGLFGYTAASSLIQSVGLAGVTVSGRDNVGGLVGYNSGTINNSYINNYYYDSNNNYIYAAVTVRGRNNVGGLVGTNSGGVGGNNTATGTGALGSTASISSSYVNGGTVTGTANVGGLVGLNSGGAGGNNNTASYGIGGAGGAATISNSSVSNVTVSGTNNVGGLVGWNRGGVGGNNTVTNGVYGTGGAGGAANISNSYVSGGTVSATGTGTISSNINVGGLVGLNSGGVGGQNTTNITAPTSVSKGGIGGAGGAAIISNSYVSGGTVSASGTYSNVGGLVGLNSAGAGGNNNGTAAYGGVAGAGGAATIGNSYVSGGTVSATGTNSNVGGLVGFNYGGNGGTNNATNGTGGAGGAAAISNSYVDSTTVSGTGNVGGLVGLNKAGVGGLASNSTACTGSAAVCNSYVSNGTVSGVGYVGGLVGNNAGLIVNTYTVGGIVTGTGTLGGLVGYNSGTISTSYSSNGVVTSNAAYGGGVAGYNTGTIINSLFDSTVTVSNGQIAELTEGTNELHGYYYSDGYSNIGAMPMTTAQFMVQANFTTDYGFVTTNWNFNTGVDNWFMIDGNTRPFLQSEWSTTITNAHQLQLIAMSSTTLNYNNYYTLANNINLGPALAVGGMWNTDTTTNNGSTGFVPVGNSDTPFSGSFNGNGHTISNLTINRPTESQVGLFGVIGSESGSVSNVTLDGAQVTGHSAVGTLAGENNGYISNVSVTSYERNTTVTDWSNGGASAGGLVGVNIGSIYNSYVSGGTVTGVHFVGGMVGSNTGSITGSTATNNTVIATGGTVANPAVSAGGLAGFNSGTISNSYVSGGLVSASNVANSAGNNVGGLVGNNNVDGSIYNSSVDNSYGNTTVSGYANIGGLVGLNNGSIGNLGTSSNNTSVSNVIVTGISTVGGLVGQNGASGTIDFSSASSNIVTENTVSALAPPVGGLVGVNLGSISNSEVSGGSVTSSGTNPINVGGLVGLNLGSIDSSDVQNGTVVSGLSNVGGLVGSNQGSISSSYVSGGTVSGTNWVGGLVGNNQGGISSSHVSDGTVSGTFAVGGLVGFNIGTVSGSSYGTDNVVQGAFSVGGLVGNNPGSISGSYVSGGTVSGIYGVGGLVGRNDFYVTSDSSTSGVTVNGTNWVGGLVGLNGYLSGSSLATITDSNATAGSVNATGSVSGNSYVGGLVGYNSGTISSSNASGSVNASVNVSAGSVSGGNSYVGGLVGYNYNGTLSNSNSTSSVSVSGTVSGNSYIEGLGWYNTGGSSVINNESLTTTGPLTLGALSVGGNLTAESGGAINITGTVTTAGSGAVNLTSTTSTISESGTGLISTGTLTTSSSSGTYLTDASTNSVGIFFATNTGNSGDIKLTNAAPLTITGISQTGGGGAVTITNAGNISLSGEISATSIKIDAGSGNFINTAGSNALDATNGSWMVFSGNVASDTFDGLASGNQALWGMTSASNLTGYTGNRYVFANVPTLTVATNGDLSKTYGDNTTNNAVFANALAGDYTATGFVNASTYGNVFTQDTVANVFFVAPTVSSAGAATMAGVLGGPYAITVAAGTASTGYGLSYSSTNHYLTVNPLALTGAAIATAGSIYGSSLTPGLVIFSNVVGTDSVSSAASVNYTSSNLSTSGNLDAGTYKQTASSTLTGHDAGNYTFAGYTTATPNYTVNTLALAGAAIAAGSSIYGSAVTPGALTFGNVQTGTGTDVVIGAVSINSPVLSTSGNLDAGTYKQTASSTLTGHDAGNYTFAGYTTATPNYTVNTLALAGAAIAAGSSIYGSAVAPGALTFGNVQTGTGTDIVTSAVSINSPVLSTSGNLDAGTYKQTASSTLTGHDAGNYTFAGYTTSTPNYTVNTLALTGAAIATGSSIYGSAVAPGALTFGNVQTGTGTDIVTSAVSINSPVLSTSGNLDAGTYKQTASSTLTGHDAGNYTFAGYTTSTPNYTVNTLALTGAAIATGSSIYGSAVAPGALTFGNVQTGTGTDIVTSAVSINSPVLSTSGNLDAGTYKQTASSTLTGHDAGNYTFAGYTTATSNYTVTPATVSVTGITAANKVYDGTPAATLDASAAALTGVITGDSLNVAGTASGAFDNRNVGVGKTVSISGLTLGGTDAGNYMLPGKPLTATANIVPLASVTWTGGGASSNWSDGANWGGALPDGNNVLAVVIPSGASVTYDAAVASTVLQTFSSAGNMVLGGTNLSIGSFNQSAGSLTGTGILNVTNNFRQSGGTIAMTGAAVATITQASGNLGIASLSAPTVNLTASTGAITQTGPIIATVLNTLSAAGTTLTSAGNQIGNFSATDNGGGNIVLKNTSSPNTLTITGIRNDGGDITIDNTGGTGTTGPVNASGAVTVITHSPLTIGSSLTAGGNIALSAGASSPGDVLTINGAVSSTGAGSSISLTAGDSVLQNANVSSNGGGISAVATTGGISMALGTSTNTGGGALAYAAPKGNVVLAVLDAGGSGVINLSAGGNVSAVPGSTGPNLTGGAAVINAGGSASFSTQVLSLDATVAGSFAIADTSGVVFSNTVLAPTVVQQLITTATAATTSTTSSSSGSGNSSSTVSGILAPLTSTGGTGDSNILGLLNSSGATIGGTNGTFGGSDISAITSITTTTTTESGLSGGSGSNTGTGSGIFSGSTTGGSSSTASGSGSIGSGTDSSGGGNVDKNKDKDKSGTGTSSGGGSKDNNKGNPNAKPNKC